MHVTECVFACVCKYCVCVKITILVIGDLQRGEHKFSQCGNLAVVVWQDSKMVYVMSTNECPNASTTVKRRTKEGNRIDVSCPMSVKKYNQ